MRRAGRCKAFTCGLRRSPHGSLDATGSPPRPLKRGYRLAESLSVSRTVGRYAGWAALAAGRADKQEGDQTCSLLRAEQDELNPNPGVGARQRAHVRDFAAYGQGRAGELE